MPSNRRLQGARSAGSGAERDFLIDCSARPSCSGRLKPLSAGAAVNQLGVDHQRSVAGDQCTERRGSARCTREGRSPAPARRLSVCVCGVCARGGRHGRGAARPIVSLWAARSARRRPGRRLPVGLRAPLGPAWAEQRVSWGLGERRSVRPVTAVARPRQNGRQRDTRGSAVFSPSSSPTDSAGVA